MSGPRLIVGRFNRVEGDLEVSLDIDDGAVRAAYVNSPLYRGFERMLERKVHLDVLTLKSWICGTCSISQSAAADRAVAQVQGITPTPQGARMAALIHAVENAADHLTDFHLNFIPDFTRQTYADRTWQGRTVERQVIDGHPPALDPAGQRGVLARVAARLLELARTKMVMVHLAHIITPVALFVAHAKPADDGVGEGPVAAARSALGLWLRIAKGRIARCQIIAPTTWNFSPHDASGVPGPVEPVLAGAMGGEGQTAPLSVQHIVCGFDPCMICTVH